MNAPAPSRGERITLQFGLVPVPLVVYNAIDENAGKVVRKQQTPAGNFTKIDLKDAVTDKPVERSEIKMVTETSGGWVELADDEVATATGLENGTAQIIGIYQLDKMDTSTMKVSGHLQIRPQKLKVGSKYTNAFDKQYAVFFHALAATNSFALVKYTTRGSQKLAAFLPNGNGVTLHYADSIRDQAQVPSTELTDKEKAAAVKLLEQITATQPETKTVPIPENDTVAKVREYAEAKAQGAAPEAKPLQEATTVDDVLALLGASLKD